METLERTIILITFARCFKTIKFYLTHISKKYKYGLPFYDMQFTWFNIMCILEENVSFINNFIPANIIRNILNQLYLLLCRYEPKCFISGNTNL